jgi:hypothetical protein
MGTREKSSGCPRLLESFWKAVGTDNRDYPIGYIATPTDAWIGEFITHLSFRI